MLHFTTCARGRFNNPKLYSFMLNGKSHNAWQMVIDGFNWWPATLFYVIAMTLLCTHLLHGVGSIFRTLGFRSKKAASLIQHLAMGYSLFIWLGFISIPIAILVFSFGS